MNDSAFVRALQALTNFNTDFQDLLGGQRTFSQAVGQGLAIEKFHDEEIDAILMADIMQSADVGMV